MEGDWTPTKTSIQLLITYRSGSLIEFQDKMRYAQMVCGKDERYETKFGEKNDGSNDGAGTYRRDFDGMCRR